MECPVCGGRLRPTEKYDVEVDICPACKGLWLERGKLETILSRAAALPSEPSPGSGRCAAHTSCIVYHTAAAAHRAWRS